MANHGHGISGVRGVALLLAMACLAACSPLPARDPRPVATEVRPRPTTPLSAAAAQQSALHPGLSGIHPLRSGTDAFAARMALVDAATATLDVQYYIWRADLTGRLLLDALRRAADRGVAVRLLLDDNNTAGLDPLLAALDDHPHIEVRLFNPFRQRRFRPLGYATEFKRLNRRMHNKSLTADGAATLVGGRNVGDEYFDATADVGFVDLDVLVIGPVVAEVAESFDDYWDSGSAYAAGALLGPPDAEARRALAALGPGATADPAAERYLTAARDTPILRQLREGRLPFIWSSARLVVDAPSKGLAAAPESDLMLARLESTIAAPLRSELAIVSPYFVPGPRGSAVLEAYARSGIRVRILTNALESTDVAAVHSGYARYRRRLLEAGVELYELRRLARAGGREEAAAAFTGSSGASLHAKTFALDSRTIFVGSFNFDPRSARLNTEMGLVIESPLLATELSRAFDASIPQAAYRVQRGADGRLEWLEQRGDGTVLRHDTEPGTTAARRLVVRLLALLPIEGLL